MSVEQTNTPEHFSGTVSLLTNEGIVVIEINDAIVHHGHEILKRNISPEHHLDSLEVVRQIYQKLGQELDKLPERTSKSDAGFNKWVARRRSHIEIWGEHSIYYLLPENPNKQTTLLSRAAWPLVRSKINTIQDLATLSDEDIRRIRNVGERIFPLVKAMRDVARVEVEKTNDQSSGR